MLLYYTHINKKTEIVSFCWVLVCVSRDTQNLSVSFFSFLSSLWTVKNFFIFITFLCVVLLIFFSSLLFFTMLKFARVFSTVFDMSTRLVVFLVLSHVQHFFFVSFYFHYPYWLLLAQQKEKSLPSMTSESRVACWWVTSTRVIISLAIFYSNFVINSRDVFLSDWTTILFLFVVLNIFVWHFEVIWIDTNECCTVWESCMAVLFEKNEKLWERMSRCVSKSFCLII